MQVAVTGASGFIGQKLINSLVKSGHDVLAIDRKKPQTTLSGVESVILDLEQPIDASILEGSETVVHLAGEPIYGYWTKQKKKRIYRSRVVTTNSLVQAMGQMNKRPEAFICASAVGYYGDRGDEGLSETSKPGSDFLASVCVDWEKAASKAEDYNIRTVQIRTAPVVGQGGIVSLLKKYFRLGAGVWIGSGNQWFPWIYTQDLIRIYEFAIENTRLEGPINAVTSSVKQKQFMNSVGRAMHKPVIGGVPVALLKLRYGNLASSLASSLLILPSKKLHEAGFNLINKDLDHCIFRALN